MKLLLIAGGLMTVGAAAPWLLRRGPAGAAWATACSTAGCLVGLAGAASGLAPDGGAAFRRAWLGAAGGSFHVALDPLSSIFLALLFFVGACAAVYGAFYLREEPAARRAVAAGGFSLLLAAMTLVFLARNALLFLAAWEVMTVASFLLVTLDHERAEVRAAGRVYLIATHIGTAFLLAAMLLLARHAGSLEFADWAAAADRLPPGTAACIFACALIGFGAKAGLMPLHVWLPEAHPAAPSHVSALMSGVMIKTGLYGLLRLLPCLGTPPAAWGWVLLGTGLGAALAGVLLALSQDDLKRLLAYSSVENVGLIAAGIGAALIARAHGLPGVAALALAAALIHTVNHALLKALLFLCAGAVYRQTGTRRLDALGGLLRRMPGTGLCAALASVAIVGLPPFGLFAGEFLLYSAAVEGLQRGPAAMQPAMMALIAGLALTGGLAAACFARLFGIAFLGEPRGDAAGRALEAGLGLRLPMLALLLPAAGLGAAAPAVASALAPAVAACLDLAPEAVAAFLPGWRSPLGVAAAALVALAASVAVAAAARRVLLLRRPVHADGTWACGYARPTPRMQYTAASFADPIVSRCRLLVRGRRCGAPPRGDFPEAATVRVETGDVFRDGLFDPAFRHAARALARLRTAQSGRIQSYVLCILIALLALMIWGTH